MFQTYSISLAPHSKKESDHSHFVRISPPLQEVPLSAITTPDLIPFFGGRRMFPFAFPFSSLSLAEHTEQPWRWPCVIRLWSFHYRYWVLHVECVCHRPHSLQCRAHTVAITDLWRKILLARTPRSTSPLEPTISLTQPKYRVPHCHWCRTTHFLLLLDEFILWTGASIRLTSPDSLAIRIPPTPTPHWVLFCLDPYRSATAHYPFAVHFV